MTQFCPMRGVFGMFDIAFAMAQLRLLPCTNILEFCSSGGHIWGCESDTPAARQWRNGDNSSIGLSISGGAGQGSRPHDNGATATTGFMSMTRRRLGSGAVATQPWRNGDILLPHKRLQYGATATIVWRVGDA